MAKNINEESFDDSTKLKLKIFGQTFNEWIPVFINDRYTDQVYIFDFFAGSGTDKDGYPGSPLVLIETAKGESRKYCKAARKSIEFIFNEAIEDKVQELESHIENYFSECKEENTCTDCVYKYQIISSEFQPLFESEVVQEILNDRNIGKFVLLDQYGFKEINEEVFLKLIDYPRTDFIFFISSSFIKRFKEQDSTKRYIDTERISFDESKPNEVHRIIANYFKQLIPLGKEYYIHQFSIQKERNRGNYYGLIFGTNHTLGMEKFLKVCWKLDPSSGEANYNIDNNYEEGSLFFNPEAPHKKTMIKKEIKESILAGDIRDNRSGFKFTMAQGGEPSLFTLTVQDMENEGLIVRSGSVNNSSTSIHRVPQYFINLVR